MLPRFVVYGSPIPDLVLFACYNKVCFYGKTFLSKGLCSFIQWSQPLMQGEDIKNTLSKDDVIAKTSISVPYSLRLKVWVNAVHFSSAVKTISIHYLIGKLSLLGLNTFLCNWILDFLTEKPHLFRIRSSISHTTTLITVAPPGLCARFSAVHSADSPWCSNAQLEPHH